MVKIEIELEIFFDSIIIMYFYVLITDVQALRSL